MTRAPIVVVAPDAFKGSLDANGVCTAIARGITRAWPQVEVRSRPMADGGEGTLDAVLAALASHARRRTLEVSGAAGARVQAGYGIVERGGKPTAVLEAAQVVGLTDRVATASGVAHRTTRGLGEILAYLLDRGVRDFMIGLGGSSTNDGGAGMLAALGLELTDAARRPIAPTPAGLASLAHVDARALDPRLAEATITLMSDVDNPLAGERGATTVFGPQKGVMPDEVAVFDRTLAHFGALAEQAHGRSVATLPGAGAAGGLGFALQLVGAKFASGAEVVAELVRLDDAMAHADWAITGEGRSDAQTLMRKAPWVVAEHARRRGVPVSLLSGAIAADALPALHARFAGCFALPAGPATLADCIEHADELLTDRAEAMARLFAQARTRRGD